MSEAEEFERLVKQMEGLDDSERKQYLANASVNVLADIIDLSPRPDPEDIINFIISAFLMIEVDTSCYYTSHVGLRIKEILSIASDGRMVVEESTIKQIYDRMNSVGNNREYFENIYVRLSSETRSSLLTLLLLSASSDGQITAKEMDTITYVIQNNYWKKTSLRTSKPVSTSSGSSSYSGSSYSGSSSSSSYYEDEGSAFVGVILVLFLNWIGLIIAIIMKKRKTRKAAIITFFILIGLAIVLSVFLGLVVMGVINIPWLSEWINQIKQQYQPTGLQ